MLHFKLEISQAGCEGRLVNQVADIHIVNSGVEFEEGTEYQVDALYVDMNGVPQRHSFKLLHKRADGMFVLAKLVAEHIETLEQERKAEICVASYKCHEAMWPKKKEIIPIKRRTKNKP
jgi:hypothetical protein